MNLRWVQLDSVTQLQIKSRNKWVPVPKVVLVADSELEILAIQLTRAYLKEKKKWHKTRKLKAIIPGQKQFGYFIKAAEIYNNHKIKSFKIYIQAQIEGLAWTNQGRGSFPQPHQLGSSGAEDRVLEYLDKNRVRETRAILSDKDKNMSLNDNTRYFVRATKIKEGFATLEETLYVYELQKLRLGLVKSYVKKYLKKLKRKG